MHRTGAATDSVSQQNFGTESIKASPRGDSFGMASGGGQGGKGNRKKDEGNKRDRSDESISEGDSDQGSRKVSKVQEEGEYKFLVKFKDKNYKVLNPLKLSDEIKDKMGGVLNVRMLRNGNILVFCKSHMKLRP